MLRYFPPVERRKNQPHEAYQDALTQWRVAQNHFDYAEPQYVDVACYELSAAEKRLELARHGEWPGLPQLRGGVTGC